MRREEYQAKFGFALFIASLAMFFLAGMVGFVIISFARGVRAIPLTNIPWQLILGTLLMLGVSVALHLAVANVRRERQLRLRQWLWTAMGIAILFIVVQTFGLEALLKNLEGSLLAQDRQPQYGVVFFLIFVHALHVIGGMVFLRWVIYHAYRDRYDHESHWGVDLCALYWHFLDIVWILMLTTFALTSHL
ncbi:heme-copper oxidase subunit III [Blastopirellula marina]|nr:cytochrome c oxidase subunit 3 [Blastopirellula marina]